MLMPDNDDAWIFAIRQLKTDPKRRERYSSAALKTGKKFHIANVAPRFMELFKLAMARKKVKSLQA